MKHTLYTIFLIAALCFGENSIAQQDQAVLLQQSYEELENNYNQHKGDSIQTKRYAEALLQKAKNDQDVIKQADGYYRLAEITSYPENLAYLDSIIQLTKDIEDVNYPAKAHLLKAQNHGLKSQFKRAMDELVQANHYANKNNNIDQQYKTKYFIALLKEDLGESKESLAIFKNITEYYKNKFKEDPTYKNEYIIASYALGVAYNKNKIYDSASFINKKTIKLSLKYKDSLVYGRLLLSSGTTHYYKKEYQSGLDSLLKFEIISKYRPQSVGTILGANLHLGKIYSKQNDLDNSLRYLQKVDSFAFAKKYFYPEIRSAYELLIKSYRNKENTEKQLFYIDRLLAVDSVLDTNYKHVYKKMSKEYTTPNLVLEKEQIINSLQKNNQTTIIILGVLSVLSIILVILLVRNNKKKKVFQQRFLDLYEKDKDTKVAEVIPEDKERTEPTTVQTSQQNAYDLGISEIIVDDIIKRLDGFEQGKEFLQHNITVNALSKAFNTNSKYLSKIINAHKGKSFSSYINDLRIDFVIEKLKADSKFRKYTIKAIADEIGFNTTEAFSKSFYKRAGIFPSFFMKQLEKKQQEAAES